MSRLNLGVSPWQVVWPRVVLIMGLSMIFAPLNVAAFQYIPRELRGAAVGLLALLRNEGGSVGTSVAQTILERREQFHSVAARQISGSTQPGRQFLFQPVLSRLSSANWRSDFIEADGSSNSGQSARPAISHALAYFDTFFFFACVAGALVFLVFLIKRSVAEKDAHVAAPSRLNRQEILTGTELMTPEESCSHIDAITSVKQPERLECAECVKIGASWVHLRTCQECGATLCCDSSPNQHASKHARAARPSRHRVGAAGRTLVVLLSGRSFPPILTHLSGLLPNLARETLSAARATASLARSRGRAAFWT